MKYANVPDKQMKFDKYEFRNFLLKRYPQNVTDALMGIFQISFPVEFQQYVTMMDAYLNLPVEAHKRAAFECYDTDSDGLIGDFDLFLVMKNLKEEIFIAKVSEDVNAIWKVVNRKREKEVSSINNNFYRLVKQRNN